MCLSKKCRGSCSKMKSFPQVPGAGLAGATGSEEKPDTQERSCERWQDSWARTGPLAPSGLGAEYCVRNGAEVMVLLLVDPA